MNLSKFLNIFGLCFIVGIFIASFFLSELFFELFVLLIFVLACGFLLRKRIEKDFFLLLIIALIAVLCGFWRFVNVIENDEIKKEELRGKKMISGFISEEVDVREYRVKYVLETLEGKVLLNANRYPLYEYGDYLEVKGLVEEAGAFDDFDYGRYLQRYDIYGMVKRPFITKIYSKNEANIFMEGIFKVKGIFSESLQKIFPEPYESFLEGLLLGSRKGIPPDLTEQFALTGLSHIVAVSGYNITIVALFASYLFGFLSRKKRILMSILMVVIFVVMVGASASVVRAGIMGILSLLAVFYGRKYEVFSAIIFSAFLMSLLNPKIPVIDVGFQLSFLATMGLIFLSDKVIKLFFFLPEKFGLRECFSMSVAAQIFVLPVVIGNFDLLSWISPLVNLFVLPFIPLIMLFGFIAGLIGFFSSFLGHIPGLIAYLGMSIIVKSVGFFSSLKFGVWEIYNFPWWGNYAYYLFLMLKLKKGFI